MLEEKDLQAIEEIMKASEGRMMAFFEAAIMPKFDLLADGQKTLLETMAPKSRLEELEDEVALLRSVIRIHGDQIAQLKKAQ